MPEWRVFEQVETDPTSSQLYKLEQGLPLWASVFKNREIKKKKKKRTKKIS